MTLKMYLNTENLETLEFPTIEGVGLVRTEHLVFQGHAAARHLHLFQKVLLGLGDETDWFNLEYTHGAAIHDLLDDPRLSGKTVNIRLFDPPICEFVPMDREEIDQFAELAKLPAGKVHAAIEYAKDSNPMMGMRGARLLIHNTELLDMQLRAIGRAYRSMCHKARPWPPPMVGVMVPMVNKWQEFNFIKQRVINVAGDHLAIGCMLETPGALTHIKSIGNEAEFLSFGTNDLTQFVLGLSRDDSCEIVGDYIRNKIMWYDPFVRLCIEVYTMMRSAMGILKSQSVFKGEVGVCGDHACDSSSILLFKDMGINYISVPPPEYERIAAWMKSEMI